MKLLAIGIVVLLTACSDARTGEVPVVTDAQIADAQIADAQGVIPPAICDSPCPDSEACVRGTCIPTCGADEAEMHSLEAALNPRFLVTRGECVSPSATFAMPRDVLFLLQGPSDDKSTTFSLAMLLEGANPSVVRETEVQILPGEMLSAPPVLVMIFNALLFGYTTDQPGSGKLVGYSSWAGTAPGVEMSAPNYSGVAIWDKFASDSEIEILVSSLGLGTSVNGAGVYHARLDGTGSPEQVIALGHRTTGAVAHLNNGAVVVGVSDDLGEAVFMVTGVLGPGPSPIDVSTDVRVTRLDVPMHFVHLGSSLSVSADFLASVQRDAVSGAVQGIDVRQVISDAQGIRVLERERWTTGPSFDAVTPTGYGANMLRHRRGIWFVEE